MNNAINEIKNTLEGTNRITEAEYRISEVEDSPFLRKGITGNFHFLHARVLIFFTSILTLLRTKLRHLKLKYNAKKKKQL